MSHSRRILFMRRRKQHHRRAIAVWAVWPAIAMLAGVVVGSDADCVLKLRRVG